MKPQLASRAETTKATHDTFMDMLFGPITTDHRLIILTRCKGKKSKQRKKLVKKLAKKVIKKAKKEVKKEETQVDRSDVKPPSPFSS